MDRSKPSGPTYHSKISDLCFYVYGNEENIIDSNVLVSNKEVIKGDLPVPNGVYDAHMGTTDRTWLCSTCGNNKSVCPGHFGLIDLNYPVKSPLFRTELLKWLKITCYHCGHLLVEMGKNVQPDRKLTEYASSGRVNKIKKCSRCDQPHYQVKSDKKRPAVFYRIKEEAGTKGQSAITHTLEFFNHEIEEVVQRISDETVLLMNKPLRSHPKKFIIRNVRVSPNTIRPDIRRVHGTRSSNSDTTALLKTLVEINNALPETIPSREKLTQDLADTYFNLDMTYYAMIKGGGGGDVKLVTNTNKPPIAIAERFPKKVGRFRKNLMGKRVKYMIRSVITGDPKLKVNEVGIPYNHARSLEIPEVVSERNMNKVMTYFINGKDKYPGCKHIIKKSNGRTYRVEHLDPEYKLQIGDIVLRDMISGDWVNFNRQPSLLFSSISGMKARVLEEGTSTLSLNVSACSAFNADFDGDQMNALIMQNIQARNECMKISKLSRWMVSPQSGEPLFGCFQDSVIGMAEFTKHGLKFNKYHAMQMLSDVTGPVGNFDKKQYTNYEIVSMLLPEINIKNKHPSMYRREYANLLKYNPHDTTINIQRGKLLSGVLDKGVAGQGKKNSIFHNIANTYGNDYAMDVIYNLQQLVYQFFFHQSYTVGVHDINISDTAMKEVKRRIAAMVLESRKITSRLNSNKLIAPLGTKLKDFYEREQLNALSTGDDFVHPIFADINLENNGMAKLILTGSKGKPPNFISINGALGVQQISGKRFGPQAGWGRTTPYFLRYDTEPEASGYIAESYREGLTNMSYPFMCGETRFGLIANALSTSITGHQNRIAVKNLESILIDNLRKSTKGMNVVQPLYADCGYNPSKMESIKFPTIDISTKELERDYHARASDFKVKETTQLKTTLDDEFKQIIADRERYTELHLRMENHNPKEYIMSTSMPMPVNIPRIIDNTLYNYEELLEELPKKDRVLDPAYVIKQTRELCDNLDYAYMNEIQRNKKARIPERFKCATQLFKVALRSYLSSKQLVRKGMVNALFDIAIEKIYLTFKQALIEYGSSVGILAAQCVSEPMTQFVLNSKHRTGGQGGTETSEIVRIQEILGAKDSDKMKNVTMIIMPKEELEEDKTKVQEIANHIEMMKFKRFVYATQIFYEEYGKPTSKKFAHEEKIIKQIEKHHFGQKRPGDLANWCIRFTINNEELIFKSMNMETITTAIRKALPEVYTIHSPENAKETFLRVYLRNSYFKQSKNFYEDSVFPLMEKLQNVIVRGFDDIISTTVVDVIKHKRQPDGSLKRLKVYGIYVLGGNMVDIAKNPDIDMKRVQSDSIKEIERTYGIVAAKNKIINEMIKTLGDLNPIHCSIYADEMTFTGTVTSIQKTGLQKREKSNITLRMSFQSPIQVIQDAAINGLTDRVSGISGPLILGTNPRVGTTYNKLIIDEDFIKQRANQLEEALDDL